MLDKSNTSNTCPCTSGVPYATCCEPYHQGKAPATPTALMRSRFAAFALADAVYLYRTLHPDHDDYAAGAAIFRDQLTQHHAHQRYHTLNILDTRPSDTPGAHGAAQVLFFAGIKSRGKDASFVERSYFVHTEAGWRYLTGQLRTRQQLTSHGITDVHALSIDQFERVRG